MLADVPDRTPARAVSLGLSDPSPLVRREALLALERQAPQRRRELAGPLLSDRSRIVRLAAVEALAGVPARELDAREKQAFDAAFGELEASMRFSADRPESHTYHGTLLARLGRSEAASQEFQQAIALDRSYAPAYLNWADTARAAGDEATAARVLREGLSRTAGDPALRHALGLTLVREKRMPEALRELEAAALAAPDNTRFGYVYAVALQSAGRLDDARLALDRALRRAPEDRELLMAAAQYAREMADAGAQRSYVARALRAYPDDRALASWAEALERTP